MERIDKLLSSCLNISRKDAAAYIKKGRVTVNDCVVKSVSQKLDEDNDVIKLDGKALKYSRFVYIMMNKPKGVISASDGKNEKTVIDLLPDDMKRKNLFPAGRLDKDTTGFVLITDDGAFAHRILSPKNHIEKTYIATLDNPVSDEVITAFEQGVQLKDDLCMPARLNVLTDDKKTARVVIKQGMYHQIKRMFAKYSLTVIDLKRIKLGDLSLDNSLNPGECRYITEDELLLIESPDYNK